MMIRPPRSAPHPCRRSIGPGWRLGLAAALAALAAGAQEVVTHPLPDPLLGADGRRITRAAEWEGGLRAGVLATFEREVYGRTPEQGVEMTAEVREDVVTGEGRLRRKQVRLTFRSELGQATADLLLYAPAGAPGRVPVFLGLNTGGNWTVSTDEGVFAAEGRKRGRHERRWPVGFITREGCAVATLCCDDFPGQGPGELRGERAAAVSAGPARPGSGTVGRDRDLGLGLEPGARLPGDRSGGGSRAGGGDRAFPAREGVALGRRARSPLRPGDRQRLRLRRRRPLQADRGGDGARDQHGVPALVLRQLPRLRRPGGGAAGRPAPARRAGGPARGRHRQREPGHVGGSRGGADGTRARRARLRAVRDPPRSPRPRARPAAASIITCGRASTTSCWTIGENTSSSPRRSGAGPPPEPTAPFRRGRACGSRPRTGPPRRAW